MSDPSRHYYHLILSRFPRQHFDDILRTMKGHYAHFNAEVKGVVASLFGPSESPHSVHFTHLRVAAFDSFDAHDAYQKAPLHDSTAGYLLGLAEDMVAGDIEGPRLLGPRAGSYAVTLLRPRAGAGDAPPAPALAAVEAMRRGQSGLAFLELTPNLSAYSKGWSLVLAAAFTTPAVCTAFESSRERAALMALLAPQFETETVTTSRLAQ